MRIAQLSTRYPPGPGGVERHVEEISKRLARRGHDVTVLTTELRREFPPERFDRSVLRSERRDGVEIHRLPAWTLPGELHYPFVRGLRAAVAAARPDIVHAHTYGTNQVAVARWYRRTSRVPFVLTAHFHPTWSIEGGWIRHRLRGFYDRLLAAPVMASAARVIVQSEEEERLLRVNRFPLPPVARIPPGYAPPTATSLGERAFSRSLGFEGPFVLFVGRLASNKGLLPLVEAFRSLHQHDPSARLVLVGADGGMGARVDAAAHEAGVSDRVIRTGFLADEGMLAAAFAEARVFVLPSEYEAFGLVLLEALAQGTPVVASRVGGIPEFIEDGSSGRLVAPADAGAIAEAILSLWDDPEERRRLGERGRTQVVPRYDWERVVDRLESVYAEVLGR